ncbi:MAG: heme ABC exporter ATP-binding protein CcmA [Afipia sp.]|nr:heme ABC exporter ATP-binding protein CcmA [Afipia sp.]OJW63084.1 MAG: heme ABC exporter, ATP-binding protein CcmA [Afipia sp. 64-13]
MQLFGRDVTCVRGGREIFAGLDFALAAGTALAITGANGAGKSSLLRIIAGLLPISGGAVALEGGDGELTLAEQAHYLGHRDPIKGALTARENLAFWRDYLGGGDGEDLVVSLKAAGLGHVADLPAAYLSAGQRRRLSMARLLAVKRPLWLLDEPTSALDTAGQAVFASIMTTHLAAGGLIAAATHTPLGIAADELRIGAA